MIYSHSHISIVIEIHILSALFFDVTLHFIPYCHGLLSPCSQQASGHTLDIKLLSGSCWPVLLMLSSLHDKR